MLLALTPSTPSTPPLQVICMNMFGSIKYGEEMNRHVNFESFPHSLQTLTRMLTG